MNAPQRRLPVGAEIVPGGAHFRVWAPRRRTVEVVFEPAGKVLPLGGEQGGYFSGFAPGARAGDLYRYRLDGGERFPDPASRFQPEGPHGPSQLVDPLAFEWEDGSWNGASLPGQVLYEMHVGTFTREGNWAGAARQLAALAEVGVTVLELMPVADFSGRYGWGYDGVNLFAPTRLYGTPDDFRRFVDAAHRQGLGVMLDVVYNHFGPDGNYLAQFSDTYTSSRHHTDWGDALNFDDEGSGPVREYFMANARYWIEEYHLDGLRLDATQSVYDDSDEHILTALTRLVRQAAVGRSTIVVAENEPQEVRMVLPVEAGGYGLDGLWNDDLHHTAMVALTGHREAYYTDYGGTPQEFVSAAKYGYLYQGQRYKWQRKRRGTPTFGVEPSRFVAYLENHDQVANSARGQRLHQVTSPGRCRTLTAFLLLGPGTPLLFQGQEFASTSPFLFFADHEPELAERVRRGRREFMAQWRSMARPEAEEMLPDPMERSTFERCVLDHDERDRHAEAAALHRDLLRLRRTDPGLDPTQPRRLDGAVLADQVFLLRYFGPEKSDGRDRDRLLLFNLGPELEMDIAPEPLLAAPLERAWSLLWSSEDPGYGGVGTADPETDTGWRLPAESALVLAPRPWNAAERGAAEIERRQGPTDRRTTETRR